MPMSHYVRRLREKVGNDLVLLPAVSVLPWDSEGRLLLVREAETGQWQTIGGSVEVDEDPAEAARREAREEAAVGVELGDVIGVLGGPQFRVEYPNGDQVAYVSVVYEAAVVDGVPTPDQDEVNEVSWVGIDDLDDLDLSPFTRQMFTALGLAGVG